MTAKFLIVASLALLVPSAIEACQHPPQAQITTVEAPLNRPPPKQEDFEDALKQCLKKNNIPEKAVKGVQNGDLQCIVKYAWTKPQCSAKPFLSAKHDYKDTFNFTEPERRKIKIHPSCTKGKTGTDGYFLTLWYCLEYCQKACKAGAPEGEYPINEVSCDNQGGEGCNEKHQCVCKRDGQKCAEPKDTNFEEMLKSYEDHCLNCQNKRRTNSENRLRVCVPGTEPAAFAKKPKAAFKKYKAYRLKVAADHK